MLYTCPVFLLSLFNFGYLHICSLLCCMSTAVLSFSVQRLSCCNKLLTYYLHSQTAWRHSCMSGSLMLGLCVMWKTAWKHPPGHVWNKWLNQIQSNNLSSTDVWCCLRLFVVTLQSHVILSTKFSIRRRHLFVPVRVWIAQVAANSASEKFKS